MIGFCRFITAFVLLLMVQGGFALFADPAWPYPVTVTQPDGSTITVRMYGDEFASYTATSDGYEIVRQPDGYFYYARVVGTKAVSTTVRAKDPAQRGTQDAAALAVAARTGANNTSRLLALRSQSQDMMEAAIVDPDMELAAAIRDEKTRSGEKFKSLVILVNFKDVKFRTANPKNAFSRLLNENNYSENGAVGSAWNYYNENSNGRFDPQFDVVGPYDLAYDMAYYGEPSSSGAHDKNAREMALEACRLAQNDVGFSDYADNGVVRDVFIFYAGFSQSYSGNDPNTIWPHRSAGGLYDLSLQGQRFSGYACAGEIYGWSSGTNTMAGIGTFCHEFGHVLGWRDFYDTDYATNGTSSTFEIFSLMAGGNHNARGKVPPALTAVERYLKGWLDPVPLDDAGDYGLGLVYDDKAYIIETDTPGEYFLLETRSSRQSKWDNGIRQDLLSHFEGMFVSHIDCSDRIVAAAGMSAMALWNANKANCYAVHPCATFVKAVDGDNELTWMFPRSDVNMLSGSTHAGFKGWSGESLYRTLKNIRYSNGTTYFTLETPPDAGVWGTVVNESNIPVQGVEVFVTPYVEIQEGEVQMEAVIYPEFSATTDNYGEFSIDNIPFGTYSIYFTSDSYMEHSEVRTVKLGGTYMQVTLKSPSGSPASVAFEYGELALAIGDIRKLNYAFTPAGTTAPLNWSTTAPDIVSVRPGSAVVASGIGETTLSISFSGFTGTAECVVTVGEELSNLAAVHNEQELTATVSWTTLAERDGWTVRWRNQYDEDYESVVVTGNSFTIPDAIFNVDYDIRVSGVRYDGGTWGESAVGLVTASRPEAERVELDKQTLKINNNQEYKLSAQVYPADAYNYQILWSSSNEEVAVVDVEGNVLGISEGNAVITAQTKYGDIKATCAITVEYELTAIKKVTVYQNDCEFSWEDASHDGEFEVRLYKDGSLLMEKTQSEKYIYIPLLTAGTAYVLEVSSVREDGGSNSEEFRFTTANIQYDYPYIYIAGNYAAGTEVPLRVRDVAGALDSVTWRIDGVVAEPPSVKLEAGRYRISAMVVMADGAEEVIVKYVTVE